MDSRMKAADVKREIKESLEDFAQEELDEAYRLIEADRNKTVLEAIADIEDMLEVTKSQLLDRLELLYSKYEIEGLSYFELTGKPLNRSQQKSFKRDLEDYLNRLENEGVLIDKDFEEKLKDGKEKAKIIDYFLLPALAELELIFYEIQQRLVELFNQTTKDNINREAFEVFTTIGIGMALEKDKLDVPSITDRIWRATGAHWTDTLWYNKRVSYNDLKKAILVNAPLEGGKSYSREAINKFVNKTIFAAKRIGVSDSTFFAMESHKDLMDFLDIEKSEYVAVLDSRTTEICRNLDGSVIPNSEIRIGENAPPMHENCRSVLVPYIDIEIADKFSTRAARDKKTGKTYFIPGSMTYREWEKTSQSIN